MVLALSRFKVANEYGDAVREAFLNRPGLVDNVSGFLGLEVFTDTEDASQFYLVTRWTDVESFRSWHSSPAHHESHFGIPKGLKLDPDFTLVRTLNRIPAPGAFSQSDEVRDWAPLVSEFLTNSNTIHWLQARPDGAVVAWNRAMAEAIGAVTYSPAGTTLWPLLTKPDALRLRGIVESGTRDPTARHRLNFAARDGMPFTLECRLDVQPDGFMVIGEAVSQDEMALQEELMTQNRQFAVLLREDARKAKALAQANTQLEKALKDLDESHWHLRKIQEVLPICMSCGKVKTGDTKWEEVVDYLKRNSLFLSHGYCPSCLTERLAK